MSGRADDRDDDERSPEQLRMFPALVRQEPDPPRDQTRGRPRGQTRTTPPRERPGIRARDKVKRRAAPPAATTPDAPAPPDAPQLAPLPCPALGISFTVDLPENLAACTTPAPLVAEPRDLVAIALRHELDRLGLLQGFDELLCLPALHGVETFWYQVETVRKVLKQFRGRVLLADEVGLGKTVEAGMVLKEYLMRGMVERVLVLTPASLVGQWREEMACKFDIEFATTHDPALRRDPAAFWATPLVIASIATARRAEHLALVREQVYDLVIVDEAHRLKNRQSASWKLVDGLKRRFLLLLSATPVQNSLIELYNLLTLLKPGIFETERQFRSSYMVRGKPRVPANRERMHDLMRSAMVRNTRSMVDVHLPPRHATTVRIEPSPEERACYHELTELVRRTRANKGARRLTLRHLLSSAGSTRAAISGALARFVASDACAACEAPLRQAWHALAARYRAIDTSRKEAAMIGLLRKNPAEKKLVFVHYRATLEILSAHLLRENLAYEVFSGSMSGPDKDRAVERFRTEVPILLCTESGGEGRNLQFCNTLINFDLPWNPMAIEQRIGRVHRIGQTRDVFIFNLVTRDTLEEHVLSILDEKINMFELVVGEIGSILGELSDDGDFSELVFDAWVGTTGEDAHQAMAQLGDRLLGAKREYDASKALDDELFGDEFVSG